MYAQQPVQGQNLANFGQNILGNSYVMPLFLALAQEWLFELIVGFSGWSEHGPLKHSFAMGFEDYQFFEHFKIIGVNGINGNHRILLYVLNFGLVCLLHYLGQKCGANIMPNLPPNVAASMLHHPQYMANGLVPGLAPAAFYGLQQSMYGAYGNTGFEHLAANTAAAKTTVTTTTSTSGLASTSTTNALLGKVSPTIFSKYTF